LATSPYDSGQMERSQGISRAGSGPVRASMIQMAWLWIKHQPKSAIAQWFAQRTEGQNGRIKRIMIVAVARKLAIAHPPLFLLFFLPVPPSSLSFVRVRRETGKK
jgi:transposase